MPILTIPVENADQLLNASYLGAGALGRVERSATGGGSGFSEISTFPLVSGTRIYTVYDLAGAATSWYRVRYTTSGGGSPSEYGEEFQAGDETGGLICSLYDVKQRLSITTTDQDENLLEYIRQATDEIEGYTGRDFTGDLSDVTFQVHTYSGMRLWFDRGIQSVTSLSLAYTDQPASGGSYTLVSASNYYLDPPATDRDRGWPATSLCFLRTSSSYLADASYGAQVVGKRGFAQVPHDVQGVGVDMVVNRQLTKGATSDQAVAGPSGVPIILRDPRHRAVLDRYRVGRVR